MLQGTTMNRIQLRRRPLNSIAACAALSLAMVFAGTANADWAVNDKDANEKLEEIQNRIGKGDLNDTTSKLLEQIRISGTNLGFSATLTPNNQLQKIS